MSFMSFEKKIPLPSKVLIAKEKINENIILIDNLIFHMDLRPMNHKCAL